MKNLLLGLAFAGAILLAAQNAMAQCCDAADVDGDPNTPDVACAEPGRGREDRIPPDPNNPHLPSGVCGCVEIPGVLCTGGDVASAAGCIGIPGTVYIVDTSGTPGSAGDCALAAASACAAADCLAP